MTLLGYKMDSNLIWTFVKRRKLWQKLHHRGNYLCACCMCFNHWQKCDVHSPWPFAIIIMHHSYLEVSLVVDCQMAFQLSLVSERLRADCTLEHNRLEVHFQNSWRSVTLEVWRSGLILASTKLTDPFRQAFSVN